jgi:DNA invertase Pin-like site-specific DNA recombinase
MLIGYVCALKGDPAQALELQLDALIAAGVAPDCIYTDLAPGRRGGRPGWRNCLKALQPGTTLVVWQLDRLAPSPGRSSLSRLVAAVDDLSALGIGLKVLAGPGALIDTTMAGRCCSVFAALAAYDRALNAERAGPPSAAARPARRRSIIPAGPVAAPAAATGPVARLLGVTNAKLGDYMKDRGSKAPPTWPHLPTKSGA